MKKIIATVLAMVMALALCTTAFAAAQQYDAFDAETGATEAEDAYLMYEKATKTSIAFYWLAKNESDEFDSTKGIMYVKVTKTADADIVLKYADKNTVAMYLAKVDAVDYDGTGVAFTEIGSKCGQYKLRAGETVNDKFYTATDTTDQKVHLFKAVDTASGSTVKLLVDGKVVITSDLGTLAANTVGHTWVVDVEKGAAKCSNCGTTGKVYKSFVEVPNGADADQVAGVWVVADASNTPTETKPDSNKSPKTFDAGIAMYVGMALTSVAGSAVVIGKKKEF